MKISTAVLNILDSSACEGSQLRLPGQLDRKTYVEVAKVIETAGGKWNRKAAAHVFGGSASDAIEQLILTGEIATRQETQQFFTPKELAARLTAIADVRSGHTALEPSAGTGVLVNAMRTAGAVVDAIEIDPKLLPANDATCSCRDFLQVDPKPIFDRIVMNPPFARQNDIRHVAHAIKFLRPQGRLVAVLSSGARFRENSLAVSFRADIASRGGSFTDLPSGSFKAAGTMVNTCFVSIGGNS